MDSLMDLLARLESNSSYESMPDRLTWGHNNTFTVKECYQQISSQNQIIDSWPWKLIWKSKLRTKISCSCWIAQKAACLTQDNLKKAVFSWLIDAICARRIKRLLTTSSCIVIWQMIYGVCFALFLVFTGLGHIM